MSNLLIGLCVGMVVAAAVDMFAYYLITKKCEETGLTVQEMLRRIK